MKILHTADLHLGCSLGAEKRFDEYDSLLNNLCTVIEQEKIEAVIIAGDVFDNHLPPNRAAEQYYRFLLQAGKAGAGKIIITGGNHDSAAYLEAPKEILKHLSVHVFANASNGFFIIPYADIEKAYTWSNKYTYAYIKARCLPKRIKMYYLSRNKAKEAVQSILWKMEQVSHTNP